MRPRFRYVIFVMMLIITMLNYIDRGAMSYANAAIISEYGLDRIAWGKVLGYFGYGYMFGALLGGALSDVWGTRRLWMIAGFAWSAFEGASAFAGDLGLAVFGGSALAGFAVVRIAFGFSEGPVYSVINKTMSAWTAPQDRATSVAIGLLSTPLGALVTAPVSVGLLLLTGSWRVTFVLLAVISAAALAMFLRLFTDRPADNPRVGAEELAQIEGSGAAPMPSGAMPDAAVSVVSLLKRPTLIFNTVAYFSLVYVTFMLVTWTPKYLQDEYHFSLKSLSWVGMIPWLGACITILLGGRISDFLVHRTGSLTIGRSAFAAASLALTTVCLALVSQAHTATAAIALLTLANASNSLPNVVYWTVVIDSVPAGRVGVMSGTMHFIASIAAVIAPTLTGYLSATYGYSSIFLAAAAVTLIAMVAMVLVRPGQIPRAT